MIGKKEKVRRKRREADERAELRAMRTDKDQLAKLDAEGYVAAKERYRLENRIRQNTKGD